MAGVATAYLADTMPSAAGAEWDYSVPIGNEHSPMTRDSFDSNSVYTRPSHNNHGSRSSSASRNVLALDASYSNSNRARSLNRSSEVNNPRESIDTLAYTETEKGKEPGTPNELEKNSENWIHRDKLAKIESEELHRAAIQFQRRMRAESKSSAGREIGHDSYRSGSNSTVAPSEYSEPWPDMRKESGPIRPGEDRKNWDLRRPEEIGSQEAAGSFYSNPALRKSSSRIPISTASPVPLAPSRGNRSRAATDEHDDEARGRAVGEHHAMEANPSTPSPGSRPASRGFPSSNTNTPKKTPNKATTTRKASAPPPGSRKTSAAVRSRAASSNNTARPTTAVNRPEGDPPWLATMYKPDPRLPPEEQIIPTHAKKMQQQQWEKEDRTPTTYDRDFAPLAVRPTNEEPPPTFPNEEPSPTFPKEEPPPTFPKEEPTEKPKLEEPKIEEPIKAKTPEPQQPPPLQRSTSSGYSTMPKVQDTPPLGLMPNPNWTPPVVTAQAQEKPKDEKEDKGCGCCIVM